MAARGIAWSEGTENQVCSTIVGYSGRVKTHYDHGKKQVVKVKALVLLRP